MKRLIRIEVPITIDSTNRKACGECEFLCRPVPVGGAACCDFFDEPLVAKGWQVMRTPECLAAEVEEES
jgi:hypothetical protein